MTLAHSKYSRRLRKSSLKAQKCIEYLKSIIPVKKWHNNSLYWFLRCRFAAPNEYKRYNKITLEFENHIETYKDHKLYSKSLDDRSKIYVLKCEDNGYYIGMTTNLYTRLSMHLLCGGAWFTEKYMPIKIVQILDVSYKERYKIENEVTEIYKNKYPNLRVCGGGFVQRAKIEARFISNNIIDNAFPTPRDVSERDHSGNSENLQR